MPTTAVPQSQTRIPQSTGAPVSPQSGAPDPAGSGGTSTGDDSSLFSSFASSLSGVAPYALAGGLGLFEGNQAAKQNAQKEAQLTALGQPLINQGSNLIQRGNAGQLTPAEQNVVTTAQQQGQELIDKASPLYSIASSAFSTYQAGQLQPWQQKQLDASVAAQKAAVQQQFASMGLTGSTQELQQLAEIDNQAQITKGQIMAQNLDVGDQQFSAWLTTTEQGQAVQMAGKQFAVAALNNDLTTGLQFSQAGMEPIQQAVALGIQQDGQLSGNIMQLMAGLSTAYAKATYSKASGAGGAASGASGLLGSLGKLFGGAGQISGGALDTQNYANDLATAGAAQSQMITDFDTQLANQQVDPSWFNDPSVTDIPPIDFGGDGG